ncbi:MAG: hypothetical protein JNM88_02275 [Chitinophagaceae bacterium]|nr:hypothetical protein [Chitinophagaceae bacterium]
MKRIPLCLILLFSLNAHACLNIFAVDSTGKAHYLEHWFFFSIEFKQKEIAKNCKAVEKKLLAGDYSYKNVSDYGAWLLMAGRFAEGLDLFRGLSKKFPSVYEVNANTAVAYELNGNIDSALYWENAALKIRPSAHNNSEWIHLKILEARKELQSDAGWCLKNNITGVVNYVKEYYRPETHGEGRSMEIFRQFIDQLGERFPFTYAGDKVMGKLMMELGDAYQAASIYRSYYCYAIAKYLYPALAEELNEKMRLILMKYPAGQTKLDGQSITLQKNNSPASKEMTAPEEREVTQFVNKLVHRPAIKNNKIKPLNISELVKKAV